MASGVSCPTAEVVPSGFWVTVAPGSNLAVRPDCRARPLDGCRRTDQPRCRDDPHHGDRGGGGRQESDGQCSLGIRQVSWSRWRLRLSDFCDLRDGLPVCAGSTGGNDEDDYRLRSALIARPLCDHGAAWLVRRPPNNSDRSAFGKYPVHCVCFSEPYKGHARVHEILD